MIANGNSLYVFGGLLEGNFETNELWRFDVSGGVWTRVHDFHRIDDPLETDSPGSALKGRWKAKNKTMRATLKLGSSFRKQPASSPAPKPAMSKTVTSSMGKSESTKALKKKKKQWELPPFEEEKMGETRKDPESPVSMMMSNSIVLKCYSKKPLKDIYSGPEMRSKGDIAGRVPHARDGHAAVALCKKMVIFGGDRRKLSFGDIHYYVME
eukprot:TRINITY_DN4517_c0_g1_i3.p3 TRINITY_DN4517_c0_g1~~TRINITY_DN4517_c0_g1_i3.p3  ORF type:complete len:211 (+),score=60.97 TRINITY_DN4517_c0_g1_i3:1027-1659(+)